MGRYFPGMIPRKKKWDRSTTLTTQGTSDFKVTARPAAVALGALTMAGRNNQDVMAR